MLLFLLAPPVNFAVEGKVEPAHLASVTLYGATTPFTVSALSDGSGRFRFKNLESGTYTLSVFVPNFGEQRRTIVLSPSTTDAKGRLRVSFTLDQTRVRPDASSVISMRQLSIPDKAKDEYREAQKDLSRRDIEPAVAHLEKAVEIAPQYSEAWNHLGTIAYQTQKYERAEKMFLRALQADEAAYAPLVNLGGVLLNLGRPDEAWSYNVHAVLREPRDALAQSQLGMTYLTLGKLELAEQHLKEAIKLDPAHFSHPQISLAEVHLRRGEKRKAADTLENFLEQNPDHPNAIKMREGIEKLRQPPEP